MRTFGLGPRRSDGLADQDHPKDQEEDRHDRCIVLIEPGFPSVQNLVRPISDEECGQDRRRHAQYGDQDVDGDGCNLLTTREDS
jgi:hypothetical protein